MKKVSKPKQRGMWGFNSAARVLGL